MNAIKEAIRQIVMNGGKASYPYKTRRKDWIEDAKIRQSGLWDDSNERRFAVYIPSSGWEHYKTLDEAMAAFCVCVFTRRNIALAYQGILALGWADDLDDLNEAQFKALVKKFNDEQFADLYE